MKQFTETNRNACAQRCGPSARLDFGLRSGFLVYGCFAERHWLGRTPRDGPKASCWVCAQTPWILARQPYTKNSVPISKSRPAGGPSHCTRTLRLASHMLGGQGPHSPPVGLRAARSPGTRLTRGLACPSRPDGGPSPWAKGNSDRQTKQNHRSSAHPPEAPGTMPTLAAKPALP